ncbi:formimidoylglutamate deiminase [Rhodoferax sp.]|uniref:formimidoylglutamate deiminase n=1 Tax=Rhodoferax sp. TaxID=50421 RepID=UPI00261EB4C8|nr:formimidoylglutamate deiminase [Rhodoferax sp.]MDD2925701.1 formimidoylglutamate deiminase [Rhodoferax sp.]
MPDQQEQRFFAANAWVDGAWARDVLLTVDASGTWRDIQTNTTPDLALAVTRLDGPVLPGLVNAHSHAFQRAIVGLTERRSGTGAALRDDFWSWRDRMYSVARRVTPDQLEQIAAMLYAELLAGGYTQVCEFHYLHHAADGQPQADPLAMSLALVRAAQRVGIGLTLLPTLYMRAGFGAPGLREDQRRFASTPDSLLRLVQDLQAQTAAAPRVNIGVAVHSLRAADAAAVKDVGAWASQAGWPIHIHVAEQTQEVADCFAHTGQRPIEWLLAHLPVNEHWNLVHATHTTPAELAAVRASGAAIVICPSTEANLGDGVFDYTGYAQVGGRWSIGSDSHVTRCWSEELRLLEYAQRLTQRRRNVATQTGSSASSAAVLFEAALAGGASATARPLGALAVGQRADFLVLDVQADALLGVPAGHWLDALVFSSPDARFRSVHVAGQPVIRDGTLADADAWQRIRQDFVRTMRQLWSA